MSTTHSQPPAAGEAAHTPTPWRIVNDGGICTHHCNHGGESLVVAPGFEVCLPGDRAFIVRACNSHDALVAALENAVHEMASAETYIEARGGGKENAYAEALHVALVQARAALAAAKGVQS